MKTSGKVLFYAVTMMYWFSMYTYVPILSLYVEHLGGSIFMIGLVVGSYGFTQLLVRIPLGIWSDRISKRRIFIITGIACAVLSSLGLAWTENIWMIFGFRSLAGIAAASWVAFTVLFASYFEPDEAPKAMGIISFYTSIGQMAATTIGGFLADYISWSAPFYMGALVGLIGLILALKLVEKQTEVKKKPVEVKELMKMGGEKLLLSVSLLAIIVQCITFTTMFGFTPLHAVALGASNAGLSILTLLSTLPNAIAGYMSGSFFVRRIGERQTVLLGFLVAATCTIILPFTTSFTLLIITQAFNGFAQGLMMPVLMGLAIQSVNEERRASAMGFFQSLYSLGMFGGPFIAGWIGEWVSLSTGFIMIGGLSFIGSILAYKWLPNSSIKLNNNSLSQ
ncbi:MFS transporter [Lederbergia lenta]|uniref:Putative transporter, major facilitator family n=1 Tax=Lederbergia lenta TaxID=1467 RepID=A0A2X4Z3V1_LEDLE|nr:MFS transporter [Lederbergia lenta]MEC2325423.1 MFS transporter [Lederbergia lenta]SQI55324.1 putative transporter, major facilitator family [Lederbergia lenta]